MNLKTFSCVRMSQTETSCVPCDHNDAPWSPRFFCPECGDTVKDAGQHLRQSPDCFPPELVENSDDEEDDELEVLRPVPNLAACMQPSAELSARIALDLAEMRNEWGLDNTQISKLKHKVQGWVQHDRSEFCTSIQTNLKPCLLDSALKTAADRDLFHTIASEKREIAAVKQIAPYIEPDTVQLSKEKGDSVTSCRLPKLIERKLQRDPAFRRRILERSDYYKSGIAYATPPSELSELDDSVKARYHSKLMRPAQPGEENHVRMAGLFNCDDVEVRGPAPNPVHTPAHCFTV
jgi:hypothetical protein